MDPAAALELEYISRQKAMYAEMDRFESPVQQFYCGATVFVTGGSGFLGKQLVEKLFRACNVGKIYILLRSKKGKKFQDRLAEALRDPVFDVLRSKKPSFEDKITAVEGDVSELRLGLSDQDWANIIKEVNMIFHMAATTRFDEKLRVATLINVRGTREALALGKACKNLRCFVHVSTAYVNATMERIQTEVQEKFYPTPVEPKLMIEMAETIDDARLDGIAKPLIKGYPNTYTFAKSIAEEQVRTAAEDVPICIVRPGIVIGSYREPTPGWIDMSCANSATGIILGPATGLIHTALLDYNARFSIVPVDFVNNVSIAAGWETSRKYEVGYRNVDIYAVSSRKNLSDGHDIVSCAREFGHKLPMPLAKYYIFINTTSDFTVYLLLNWFYHFIPGYLFDGVCVLLRKPPIFTKFYRKVHRLSIALSYFTIHTWYFNDDNTERLFKSLAPGDQQIFNFDSSSIDTKELFSVWCLGIRKYLLKDGLKNTEYARKKQFWFHKLHYVVLALYLYCLWKLLSLAFACIAYVLSFVL